MKALFRRKPGNPIAGEKENPDNPVNPVQKYFK
jgi:hypothetical protein